jgi:hypothetical protein
MAKKRTRRKRFLSEYGDRPGVQRHPHPAGPQRLRECTMQAPGDQGCIVHSGLQHIGNQTKDLTSQSPRFIVGKEVHLRIRSDSLSFVPVHPGSGYSGLGVYTTQRDAAP